MLYLMAISHVIFYCFEREGFEVKMEVMALKKSTSFDETLKIMLSEEILALL
jgi:hypothetical protein